MSGWIKLYRSIRDHWVFQDESYFRAWCIILMKVNHEPKKSLIHGRLVDCERGQSLLSLQSWVEEFGVNRWSIKKVRTFFKLLENDGMIITEGMQKTTRLTVCNYETYQDLGQTKGKQRADKGQAKGKQRATTKEYKETKEPKEPKEKKPIASRSVLKQKSENNFIDQIVDQFAEAHGDYEIMARGKERKAAGVILSKYKEKFPGADSDETIKGLRAYFDKCVNIKDDWYRQNMSLPLIVSKFPQINKILKNGSAGKGKSQGVSDNFRKWVYDGLCTAEGNQAMQGN